MNVIYFGLFLNFPLMGFFWAFLYKDIKLVEFASVAICLTFFHKMTGLFLILEANFYFHMQRLRKFLLLNISY